MIDTRRFNVTGNAQTVCTEMTVGFRSPVSEAKDATCTLPGAREGNRPTPHHSLELPAWSHGPQGENTTIRLEPTISIDAANRSSRRRASNQLRQCPT